MPTHFRLMKISRKYFLLFTMMVSFLFSCSQQEKKKTEAATNQEVKTPKDDFKSDSVYASVLSSDGMQHFSVYLPAGWKPELHFPVMIFFDPHADGTYPVHKYKGLASKFNFVLMGSNDAENGMNFDQTNAIAGKLINEAILRFSCDSKQISLSGFSGGAKAALAAASTHPEVTSVCYCGAAFPAGSLSSIPPALGFAGLKDMNYTEVIAFNKALDSLPIHHAVEEWTGKHEWPDSLSFSAAFAWAVLKSSSVKNEDQIKLTEAFISGLEKRSKSADILLREKSLIELIAFINDSTKKSNYSKQVQNLHSNTALLSRVKQEETIFAKENYAKQQYVQAFEAAPLSWWENEINKLKANKNDYSQQRLLGYISLAGWSFSNNALKQGNLAAAEKSIAVYGLADPENPEQHFFEACLLATKHDDDKAVLALKKATDLGLTSKSKVENEPAFSGLFSRSDFQEILRSLK